jgi:hypothetical protein
MTASAALTAAKSTSSANGGEARPALDDATACKLAELVGEMAGGSASGGVDDSTDIVHFYEEYAGADDNDGSRRVVFARGFQPDQSADAMENSLIDAAAASVLHVKDEEEATARERADMLAALKRLERMDEIALEEEAALTKAGLHTRSSPAERVVKAQGFGSGLSKGFLDRPGSRKQAVKKVEAAKHPGRSSFDVMNQATSALHSLDVPAGLERVPPPALKSKEDTSKLPPWSSKQKSALKSQNSGERSGKMGRRVSFPSSLILGSGAGYARPIDARGTCELGKLPAHVCRAKSATDSVLSPSSSNSSGEELGLLEEVEQAEQIDLGGIVTSDRLDFINQMLVMEAEEEALEQELSRESEFSCDFDEEDEEEEEGVVDDDRAAFGTGFISSFLEPGVMPVYTQSAAPSEGDKETKGTEDSRATPSLIQPSVATQTNLVEVCPRSSAAAPADCVHTTAGSLYRSSKDARNSSGPAAVVQSSDLVCETVIERPRRARASRKSSAFPNAVNPPPLVPCIPSLRGDGRGGLVCDAWHDKALPGIVSVGDEEDDDESAPRISHFKQMQNLRRGC